MHIEPTLSGFREVPDPPHRVPRWDRILSAIAFTLFLPLGTILLALNIYVRIFSGVVDDTRRDEWGINQAINKSLESPLTSLYVAILLFFTFIFPICKLAFKQQ